MLIKTTVRALAILALTTAAFAQPGAPPPTPAKTIRGNFDNISKRILEMAKDFPEDKYNFKPNPDVRSFGEVIVHICGGFQFGAKRGSGQNVQWDEFDYAPYKTKAQIVALAEQQLAAANATLKSWPDDRFKETISPWVGVIEHTAEHYGQLVVYYRLNGLVPPESRPKKP
jgi:uncharacterized damage-inducible protein DinB